MSQYTTGNDAIDRHSKMMDLSQKVEDLGAASHKQK